MAALTPSFFQTILKMEGGFQSRSDDSANWVCGQLIGTKYGVSALAFREWANRCPTREDIEDMSTDTAWNFYAWYFDRYNLFAVENQQFAELLMNNTMGSPVGAAKSEQRALNQFGYNLSVDGARGPKTIAALNDAWRNHGPKIYDAVRAEWIAYLYRINKPQFIQGWLNRLNKYFPPLSTGTAFTGLGLLILFSVGLYLAQK